MAMIRAVRCVRVEGHGDVLASEERQVGMLDIYPTYAARGPVGGDGKASVAAITQYTSKSSRTTVAVGLFGPIFEETATMIQHKLASHLIGQDPLAGEYLWDLLYRQDRHARAGYEMIAISAVDNALWDLRGKLMGQPVYRLLGGPTRERVPCYASMLGSSLEPERVRDAGAGNGRGGVQGAKVVFPLRAERRPRRHGAQHRPRPHGARSGRAAYRVDVRLLDGVGRDVRHTPARRRSPMCARAGWKSRCRPTGWAISR